jgi:hypothetical protein
MADVVYAVMDSEVLVEDGGIRGQGESKAEAVVPAEMKRMMELSFQLLWWWCQLQKGKTRLLVGCCLCVCP